MAFHLPLPLHSCQNYAAVQIIFQHLFPQTAKLATTKALDADETQIGLPCDTNSVIPLADNPL